MKSERSELLFINFKVDSKDPVLGFAPRIIAEFSKEFYSITVLTGFFSGETIAGNVKITSTNWAPGQNLRNVIKFYYYLIKILINDKPVLCYTHQAAPQATLAAPILKLFRIKQILWYASVSNSWAIKLATKVIDRLVTSTNLSKPFESHKYFVIGQAIQTEGISKKNSFTKKQNLNFVNVGRLDPSKGLENIIDCLKEQTHIGSFTFNHFGATTQNSGEYKKHLQSIYLDEIVSGQLKFNGGIEYSLLVNTYAKFDVFIHSFDGSLDKVLIEALAGGIPIVTTNRAFKEIFGSWATKIGATLNEELKSFLAMNEEEINGRLVNQSTILASQHSLQTFPNRIRQQFNALG